MLYFQWQMLGFSVAEVIFLSVRQVLITWLGNQKLSYSKIHATEKGNICH